MKRLSARFLLIVCISCLLAGCTININIGNPPKDATNEADSKTFLDNFVNSEKQKILYESCASIYITTTTATDATISSSDLKVAKSLVETYNTILQTNMIQSQIREQYPDIEYTLSLEPIEETEIFALIATGEEPEHLEEICNRAVSLLCEKIPQIVDGVSCKVVDYAKPAQLVGKN